MSREDEQILSFYVENLTEIVDNNGQRRLQLRLPWKKGYPNEVPESLHIAKQRLMSQIKRLYNQPETAQKYQETFEKMKAEGHAEPVEGSTYDNVKRKPTNYITHFSTAQQKFRVVYNGALAINGISLNDMLYRGPMFIESLVGILIRFRQYSYAVTGDIKNMFFQISLHPDDRDMLRFLPFNADVDKNFQTWRFTVMPYGLVCVPSIAGFCIRYTALKNYANVSPDTVHRVKNDFYVDDFITSINTVAEAKRVIKEATKLLASTGFTLTKFSSNCADILKDVNRDNLAPPFKEINLAKDGLPQQKTLGMLWNADRDCMELHSKDVTDTPGNLTRRKALSYLNSYFDPLGLWCPFFVKLKLCYSEIVVETNGWDDKIHPELEQKWKGITLDLKNLSSLPFPRQYSTMDGAYELHLFCDASQYGMGACIYLRTTQRTTNKSSLVAGKTRIFPQTKIQKFSIARKELVALCLGTDLLSQVKKHLSITIDKTYLWTDSMTVIKWCQCKTKQLSQFVRNRVDKILDGSSGLCPNYVDTKNNPADMASRGITLKQTKDWKLWVNGPAFLCQPKESWKVAENHCEQLEVAEKDYESEVLTEIKLPAKKINFIYQKRLNTILNLLSDSSSSMEAESRLLNLCRCFNGLRGKNNSPLATMTRKKARSLLLKMAQQVELGAIINEMLRHGVTFEQAVLKIPVKERPQHLMQLFKYVSFYDGEGLLRIGGKLQNSDMNFQIKHPILLPFRHWTTELYIKKKHTECGHFGPDFVFGSLHYDSGLWAIGGTATVRHYIKDCQGCRLRRQKRGEQLMAPLPASR